MTLVLGHLGDLLLLQVLVHSTVQWGLKHQQLTLPEAEKHLATAMAELFPNWPKPKELKTLKWLYSQVDLPTQTNPILLKTFLCHTDTQSSGRRVYPQYSTMKSADHPVCAARCTKASQAPREVSSSLKVRPCFSEVHTSLCLAEILPLGTLTNPSELHDDGTIEDLNI